MIINIVIIIKKLIVNHGFTFPETLEVSKKDTKLSMRNATMPDKKSHAF